MSNIQSDDFYFELSRFFRQAIIDLPGSEDKLFEMMDVLGPHIKQEYILWTLTNNEPRTRIVEESPTREKVKAIKSYRAATGVGLREAKDAVEGTRNIAEDLRKVHGSAYAELTRELERSGYRMK